MKGLPQVALIALSEYKEDGPRERVPFERRGSRLVKRDPADLRLSLHDLEHDLGAKVCIQIGVGCCRDSVSYSFCQAG